MITDDLKNDMEDESKPKVCEQYEKYVEQVKMMKRLVIMRLRSHLGTLVILWLP